MFGRTLLVWLLIILLESLFGVARTLLLEPMLGRIRARQAGILMGLIMIFAVSWLCLGWVGIRSARQAVAVGAVWVPLTLAFECLIGRAIMRKSWDDILAEYDVTKGGFMIAGLLLMGLMPLIVLKLR